MTDPNGNQTAYLYDDFRRMRQQTSPVSGVTSYSYDPAGNLLAGTDANGAATARMYDAANRVTSAVSTRTGFQTETATWTYDDPTPGNYGKGRLAAMADPSGSAAYAYERRGLLVSESRAVGGSLLPFTLGYVYDANGNRPVINYPSGNLVRYEFDFADRPKRACGTADPGCLGALYVSSGSYQPFGPLSSFTYGNGTSKTVNYDQRYRPTEVRLSPVSGGPIADYFYGQDPIGNITSICAAQPCPTPSAPYDRVFGYDDLNRLTTAKSGSSLWGTAPGNGYTYDRMGNVLSLALGTSRTATFTYSGTLPKLSQVTETGPGTRSVVYDAAANETMVGTSAFTYSPRNNLAVADGLTYTYDGRGLRTIVRDGSGNLRYFFYSPEMNLLEETSFGPNPSAAGGYDYVWFNGQPVAEKDGGIHWTFTDHLGTPLIQTDSGGLTFWRAEYEPYGRVFALRTADQHQPLRLPGQEAEQLNLGANGVTERFYNIFRWYRPNWGRYNQSDPIGLKMPRARHTQADPLEAHADFGSLRYISDDPIGVQGGNNLYTYVAGNPLSWSDPRGLEPCCPTTSGGTANCVRACVTQLLVNPFKYVLGLASLGTIVSVGSTRVMDGVLSAGQAAGGRAGAHLGILLGGLTTVEALDSWIAAGITVGGGVVTGAAVVGAFGAGYGIGTVGYCTYNCVRDPCRYR